MFEIFQLSVIRQDFRERSNSMVKAGEMDSAVSLGIWLEIPLGSEAVLILSLESRCWILSWEHGMLDNCSCRGRGEVLLFGRVGFD